MKIVSVAEMRELERRAAELGMPGPALMENAGRATADLVTELMVSAGRARADLVAARFGRKGRRALVLVGPGNNGGDGLVAARHLHDAGFGVVVYLVNRTADADADAKVLLLRQRGVPFLSLAADPELVRLSDALRSADVILDAILGTGRSRPIAEPLAALLDQINHATSTPLVALDVPTGVDAETGAVDPRALRADLTITYGFPKRGLVQGPAVDRVGKLVVADIGIPAALASHLPVDYVEAEAIRPRLPRRTLASNKGTFGRALIVSGSRLYTGAPVLAARAAERIGAGLVTLACPASVRPSLAAHTLESTFLPLPDADSGELIPAALETLRTRLDDYRAVLIGPGIGRSAETAAFLNGFLAGLRAAQAHPPLVIDADALTLLAEIDNFWERLPHPTILTPHPGEMARLLRGPIPEDRIGVARNAAERWSCSLILKGAYSIVASPDGRATVLPFANPALATAGTGDVLAGAIVGLLAQGLDPDESAVVGGFVHGVAGELVHREIGPAGALATDVAERLPAALDQIRAI